jgi:prepilin-type N-terminal cleavage/methylation domain-containing protein
MVDIADVVLQTRRIALSQLRKQESGFTLIELMISTMLLLIILGAVLALLDSANKVAPQETERALDIHELQTGVYGMTRELRQAYSIVSNSPYLIEAHVWENGADHDVTYDCSGNSSAGPTLGQCIRFETTASGQGPTTIVVDRLLNKPSSGRPPVFAYTTNPAGKTTYASVHVEVPSRGARKVGYGYRIALDDAFYMRNLNG